MVATQHCLPHSDSTESTDDGSGADEASSVESKPDVHGHGIDDHLEKWFARGLCWNKLLEPLHHFVVQSLATPNLANLVVAANCETLGADAVNSRLSAVPTCLGWQKTRASLLVSPMTTLRQTASCPPFLRGKHDITYTTAEAGPLGTTVWTVEKFRCMSAASTLVVHAHSLRAVNTLASDVLEMGGRYVSFTVQYKCDETPLLMNESDCEPTSSKTRGDGEELVAEASSSWQHAKQAAPTKLLQNHEAFSALFVLPDDRPCRLADTRAGHVDHEAGCLPQVCCLTWHRR